MVVGCTTTCVATASDKLYQLLAHDRWFSPGTPTSSTTKTGGRDISEIFLKVSIELALLTLLYSAFFFFFAFML